jgi:EmrB/QacA subfamily drug resistance transporter
MKKLLMDKSMATLFAVTLGSSVVLLDGNIVNLALPAMGTDMHVGFTVLQWITDAYLLSLSALILLGGSLGDIFGHKKIYLIGLIGFGVASLACAVAPSAPLLIIARILQGVFGALLVPGALAIINTNFAKKDRPQAIGRWAGWSSIAIVIAPFLAGGILAFSSWRLIFVINIPLIALCIYMVQRSVTENKSPHPRKIDVLGAFLVTLSLAGLTYGLIEGPAKSWSIETVASLIVGVVMLLLFVWHEKRSKDPMVRLSLFKSRNFLGANLMAFMMYGALGGFMFVLAIYLQTTLHYSAFAAGLSLLPVSLILFFLVGKVGGLSAKYGPRIFMTIGPLVAASGIGLLYFLHPGASYMVNVLPGILLFGVGLALLVSPLTTTVMSSVSDHQSGIASGINNAVTRAAGLIVIALLGLLGSGRVYSFAIILCTCMTIAAGVISYFMIRTTGEFKTEE